MEERVILESGGNEEKRKKIRIIFLLSVGVIVISIVAVINGFAFLWFSTFGIIIGRPIFLIAVISAVLNGIKLFLYNSKLVVTNKRVYGKALGKQVDLPMDSISAVSTTIFSGIGVATSSGRITFWGLEKRDMFYKKINELLIERQNGSMSSVKEAITVNQTLSGADEIAKYKELLDSGTISQEEFDAKKKQLLGL